MFRFENVSKTYKSKKGKDCDALKDINFSLPDTGMVFICGKSGCGKSTLLNLLGGLDMPTGGEISYNGNKFSAFKDADFSNYRNNILGFVFQDCNLIENLSVEQNITIPLSLQNKRNKKELIGEALEKVGLEGYEKQSINELSGGQKQRVAVARALVKTPEVILADEPTGNLDSKTAKEIFDLLRNLSKTRLVVVVTHDTESAANYNDYIIELSDGQIVSNTCTVQIEEKIEPLKKPKTAMPFKIAVKMGAGNLRKKTGRTVALVIVAGFTIFCIVLSQLLLYYNPANIQARIMPEKGVEVFLLGTGDPMRQTAFDFGFTPSALDKYIEDNASGTKYMICDKINYNYDNNTKEGNIIVRDSSHILAFGFEFVGDYLELDTGSVYITEAYLNKMYEASTLSSPIASFYVEKPDGVYDVLLESETPRDTIVGKKIKEKGFGSEAYYKIAGIIKTANMETTNIDEFFYADFGRSTFFVSSIFYLKDYINRKSDEVSFGKGYDINLSGKRQEKLAVDKPYANYNAPIILADGTVLQGEQVDLAPLEIVISFNLYKKLFNDNFVALDYLNVNMDLWGRTSYTLKRLPEHLGETVSVSVSEGSFKNIFNGEFIIAGISFDFSPYSGKIDDYIMPDSGILNALNDIYYIKDIMINRSSVPDLKKFLNEMRGYDYYISNQYSDLIYQTETEVNSVFYIFVLLAVVLAIIMILLVISLISLSIKDRAKELGTLKALGARNKDLFTIFFAETFILSTLIFIVGLILSSIGAWFLSFGFEMIIYDIVLKLNNLFIIEFATVLTVFVASYVVVFLAALFPLLDIKNMNPIDAIKTVR